VDRDTILAIVIEQIRTVFPDLEGEPIGAGDTMAALGIDSVSRQEILILSMEALGLNLPLVQLFGPKNLGELAQLLQSRLAG
jgi:polyketide biosynthesis acyl carrier protein